MTPHARRLVWSATRHVLLLAGAAFMLLPFVWMLSTASKPQTEIFTTDLHFIPHHFALWENLATAFGKANLWRFLLNGVIVTVSIFALQVLVALPAAYALAKLRLPWPRGAVRAGAVLHPDSATGDRDPGVPAVSQARHPRQLCGAGAAVHDLGVRHLPDAAILQDRAGRSDRGRPHGRHFRVRHRLARDAADRDSGADRVRHLLGGRALERLFLAADRAEQRASAHAAARRRAASATRKPAPTTAR